MNREKLNKHWIYKSAEGEREVTLPHDAMILRARNKNGVNTTNTGYFQGEDCSYTYMLEKKADWKNVFIEFDGVYKDAGVYVNGELLHENLYGYSNFLIDISDALMEHTVNEIRVEVHNSDMPNSRWYTGTGIYRDVFLYSSGNIAVIPGSLRIKPSDIETELAVVSVSADLRNKGDKGVFAKVYTKIFDADGALAVCCCQPLDLDGEEHFFQRTFVKAPKLWEPDAPNLYTCRLEITVDDQLVEAYQERFGIRDLRLDPIHGLRLNWKSIKLRGGCIHHDNGIIGAIDTRAAELYKIARLKEAGFNALRISHNPASKALLEVCDEIGMLVMDEAFDMWNVPKNTFDHSSCFEKDWRTVITSMVEKDYNHPCVIMYSIGNEIQEIGTKLGGQTSRRLSNLVRSLDDSRLVTNAINGMTTVMDDMDAIIPLIFTEEEIRERGIKRPVTDINYALTLFLDRTEKINMLDKVTEMLSQASSVLDIVGYNYAPARYELDLKNAPDRMVMGSESFPSDVERTWKLAERLPNTIGDFTWTAYDYLGETGIGATTYNCEPDFNQKYPYYVAYCGDIDLTGYRRPMSYYRQIVWGLRRNPYIGVWDPAHSADTAFWTPWSIGPAVASWNWDGYEGCLTHVEVYSAGDEVELLLNGTTLGRKSLNSQEYGKQNIVVYEFPYEAGELKAVSYEAGKPIGEHSLCSTKKAKALALKPSKHTAAGDGEDLVFVEITAVDEDQNPDLSCTGRIAVEVSGQGVLLGLGNADPKGADNFFDAQCSLFEGRALAVIRTAEADGAIQVTVTSDSLAESRIAISVAGKIRD